MLFLSFSLLFLWVLLLLRIKPDFSFYYFIIFTERVPKCQCWFGLLFFFPPFFPSLYFLSSSYFCPFSLSLSFPLSCRHPPFLLILLPSLFSPPSSTCPAVPVHLNDILSGSSSLVSSGVILLSSLPLPPPLTRPPLPVSFSFHVLSIMHFRFKNIISNNNSSNNRNTITTTTNHHLQQQPELPPLPAGQSAPVVGVG